MDVDKRINEAGMERELIRQGFYYTLSLTVCIQKWKWNRVRTLLRYPQLQVDGVHLLMALRTGAPRDLLCLLAGACQDRGVAFMWAAQTGHLELVKNLRKYITGDGSEALIWAARYGHVEIVQFLLDAGADIHHRRDEALCWSAEHGQTEVVRLLLSRGADIHAQNEYALRWSCMKRRYDTARYLVDQGADAFAASLWMIARGYDDRANFLHHISAEQSW